MVGEKVLRYRKLCQIYQKYKFFMSNMNNSSGAQGLQLDHLEWVQKEGREAALFEQYQTEDADELFMLIFQDSHLLIRNAKAVWQQLLDLLLGINFNLMEQLAAPEIEEERTTKTKWLLSYADIGEQHEENRSQFVAKREGILQRLDIYEDNDLHHPLLIIENFVTP